jgi:hypothetical protein
MSPHANEMLATNPQSQKHERATARQRERSTTLHRLRACDDPLGITSTTHVSRLRAWSCATSCDISCSSLKYAALADGVYASQ